MRILKTLSISTIFILVLFITYVNFSVKTTHYVCYDNSTSLPNQLFLTVETPHPWTTLLSDSHGNISYDIPLKEKGYYSFSKNNNEDLQFFKKSDNELQGTYHSIKSFVTINTSGSLFKGECLLLNESCSNNILH